MAGRRRQSTWAARPWIAWAVRAALFVTPFVAGWLAIRLTQQFFVRPPGSFGIATWVLQAAAVSASVSLLVSRLLLRLAPLPALFAMTLVFPDHAPSRFKVAMRAGTTRTLLANDEALSSNTQLAAEQAIGLIGRLSRHERLTRGHSERVRAHADVIGQQLDLPDDEMHRLRWGVLLHDVGKLKVGADILAKPGKPTPEEWEILRGHPGAAIELLAPLRSWLGDWVLAASQHHERWDGTGYPAGLAGSDISLPGRITAVADAYDVMLSRRSYKKPIPVDRARANLVASAGTHFDPAIVRALLEAGLHEPRRANPFGGLLEIPTVARIIDSAVAAPVAIATTVAVLAIPMAEPRPDELAFDSTTTTVDASPLDAVTPTSTSSSNPTNDTTISTTEVESTQTTDPTASDLETTTPLEPPTTTTTTAPATTTPVADTGSAPTDPPATITTTTATTVPTTAPPTPCELARSGQTDLPGRSLNGCDLSGLVIDGLNFDGADLRNLDLSGTSIVNFTIGDANLTGADLTGLRLTDGSLLGSTLTGVSAAGISLTRVNLESVSWPGAILDDATISEVAFLSADFSSASFRRASVSGSQLQDADFSDADLRDATFSWVGFDRSDLSGVDFTSAVFDSVTAQGAVHQTTTCPNGVVTSDTCF